MLEGSNPNPNPISNPNHKPTLSHVILRARHGILRALKEG